MKENISIRSIAPSIKAALGLAGLGAGALLLAVYVHGLGGWDLSIPLAYNSGDDIWQLILTKVLHQTGWVLTNPYLGAPDVAHWHHNAAAQTSALHSLLMLALSVWVDDPVRLQQVYYLLNFPLICMTSFLACRLLGISRLPAYCVGLLFAFTAFRVHTMFYAFLANYFMVPLALVPVIWILAGRFSKPLDEGGRLSGRLGEAGRLLRSREFLLGLGFIVLTATSDGYYAFFTLLLLGFAFFSRVLVGDWRRPVTLMPGGIYILSLLVVSLLLQLPLQNYKKTHTEEFYPNGVRDSSLVKHPFEAEVYSSSLKMMIAPSPSHHIEALGELGRKVAKTSDEARHFKQHRAVVPLGTLASMLFFVALALLVRSSLRDRRFGRRSSSSSAAADSFGENGEAGALLSLTLFIFLCSIVGGLGTLIALVFPTIRAYERFPLFLVFVLYLFAAGWLTAKLRGSNVSSRSRALRVGVAVLVTAAALYDQIPRDAIRGDESTKRRFLADRRFVQEVEASLPSGAMVYQYPYSQYLRNSQHYGWGSFAHVRLYLHSRNLRWSNGGAKNSPGDDWNFRISQLPIDDLISEVEAVGFEGFVIDRKVLGAAEYEAVRKAFADRKYEMREDEESNLTFVKLEYPGFRLVYDSTYRTPERMVITDQSKFSVSRLPGVVNADALQRFIGVQVAHFSAEIRRDEHPDIFIDGDSLMRGMGNSAILPISDMLGRMSCRVDAGGDAVLLTLDNQSSFGWKLGAGDYPIRVGVHLRTREGELLLWDDGFRVAGNAYLGRGESTAMRVPLRDVPKVDDTGQVMAEFALVQDGNAWFGWISCSLALP